MTKTAETWFYSWQKCKCTLFCHCDLDLLWFLFCYYDYQFWCSVLWVVVFVLSSCFVVVCRDFQLLVVVSQVLICLPVPMLCFVSCCQLDVDLSACSDLRVVVRWTQRRTPRQGKGWKEFILVALRLVAGGWWHQMRGGSFNHQESHGQPLQNTWTEPKHEAPKNTTHISPPSRHCRCEFQLDAVFYFVHIISNLLLCYFSICFSEILTNAQRSDTAEYCDVTAGLTFDLLDIEIPLPHFVIGNICVKCCHY